MRREFSAEDDKKLIKAGNKDLEYFVQKYNRSLRYVQQRRNRLISTHNQTRVNTKPIVDRRVADEIKKQEPLLSPFARPSWFDEPSPLLMGTARR